MGEAPKSAHSATTAASYSWIQMVADTLQRYRPDADNHLQTTVQPCSVGGIPSLVHPAALAREAPRLHRYLENFSASSGVQLIADRREKQIGTQRERRHQWAPVVALGASMLFAESGDGHSPPQPSSPQRARDPAAQLDVFEAIALAAAVRARGQRSRLTANGMLVQRRGLKHHIDHYQHRLPAAGRLRRLAYFEGKSFHALGYRCGDQLVLEVLVGGGPFNAPRLWGPMRRMARDPVQFHLVCGRGEADGFGVMKATYYLDSPAQAAAAAGSAKAPNSTGVDIDVDDPGNRSATGTGG